MHNYQQIVFSLKKFSRDLGYGCFNSFAVEENQRESILALDIVTILNDNVEYIKFMSKMHKKDLADCIHTYHSKYITSFSSHNISKEKIAKFNKDCEEILKKIHDTYETNLESKELDHIGQLVYKITKSATVLFAEQSHNKAIKDAIIANAISFQIDVLSFDDQNKLTDQLLSIKELWNLENENDANKDKNKYRFFHNFEHILSFKQDSQIVDVFDQIVCLLVDKLSILEELDDTQILHLFDRLKNLDQHDGTIYNLLEKTHTEAQYRYSYNRLDDLGYELLNRFQNYDVISHQIEKLGSIIVTSLLLKPGKLVHDILSQLIKQSDNIKFFGQTRNENLLNLIKKIDTKLHHLSGIEHNDIKSLLGVFRGKLGNPIDQQAYKKLVQLDKFEVFSLTAKYKKLFENLDNLYLDNALGRKFIRETLATTIAHSFYFSNLTNSIDKIRKLTSERKEVKELILELNLTDIFIGANLNNNILELDFKMISAGSEIKSSLDFAKAVIKEIVTKCSAFQLEILYRPLLKIDYLTPIQIFLREEVMSETHRRTSVAKMMYSVFLGRKKEYDKLSNLKKRAQKDRSTKHIKDKLPHNIVN
ncbi:MAG: hypothetical protein J0L79_02930 [Rickettsiales bacterium]|nr:hypothetical protein [Rickettsiales bacterium]MCA0254088.1 hypothetical protein [Pseudomonadota bacterium]